MIPPELVRVRRRGEKLSLVPLSPSERVRAEGLADELLSVARSLLGATNEEVLEALQGVVRDPKEEKLFLALRKLVLDVCEFGQEVEVDSAELRRELFAAAAAARARNEFARERLLREVAERFGLTPEALEGALFADLPLAQKLRSVEGLGAATLVERFDRASLQGLLLRATKVSLRLAGFAPESLREFFRSLKFRRLLFSAEREEDGTFRVEVSGPFSLFEGVTKYGMALAQLAPLLEGGAPVALRAELRWGKERRAVVFETTLGGAGRLSATPARPEIEQLLAALARLSPEVAVERADEILHVPGVGVVLPDLVFRAPGAAPVFFELLGYHSREAVWRRVEWARRGGATRILFAASSRLRVSEAVLEGDTGAELYMFKGVLNAREVVRRVLALGSPSAEDPDGHRRGRRK